MVRLWKALGIVSQGFLTAILIEIPGIAWAQTAAPGSKKYLGPYTLVVLLIAIGLVVVCKSARRSIEVKKDA